MWFALCARLLAGKQLRFLDFLSNQILMRFKSVGEKKFLRF